MTAVALVGQFMAVLGGTIVSVGRIATSCEVSHAAVL